MDPIKTRSELPPVSIIMPSHNRKDSLARAIEHLCQQTYPANLIELVVILDGCTDGSAEMLEQMRPTLPFPLKAINQPQSGPASARNTGIKRVSHDFVLMLDDDVMATPDLIMEHWRTHHQYPDTIVIGTMSWPPDYNGYVWNNWEHKMLEKQYKGIMKGKFKESFRQFYTGNCSLKRSWVIDAGMFDEKFYRYEDVELAWRMHQLGYDFKFNPAAIGYHYIQRTFESWTKAHYLYGRYAVKIEREKNVPGMIELSYDEYKYRNIVTRVLSRVLLHRKLSQKLAINLLCDTARLAVVLKRRKEAFQVMSCIANIVYWEGFNEELALSDCPVVNRV